MEYIHLYGWAHQNLKTCQFYSLFLEYCFTQQQIQCVASAFSSFPDSLQFDQGSQVHSFRIRDADSSQEMQSRSNDKRPVSEDGYIYGYSYFTQRRDASSKRGYQQVTRMSYFNGCAADCSRCGCSGPLSFWHTINTLHYSLDWRVCSAKNIRHTMCQRWKLHYIILQIGMITAVHHLVFPWFWAVRSEGRIQRLVRLSNLAFWGPLCTSNSRIP
jgi:hypothetical protein